jgi:hypothetical protein
VCSSDLQAQAPLLLVVLVAVAMDKQLVLRQPLELQTEAAAGVALLAVGLAVLAQQAVRALSSCPFQQHATQAQPQAHQQSQQVAQTQF